MLRWKKDESRGSRFAVRAWSRSQADRDAANDISKTALPTRTSVQRLPLVYFANSNKCSRSIVYGARLARLFAAWFLSRDKPRRKMGGRATRRDEKIGRSRANVKQRSTGESKANSLAEVCLFRSRKMFGSRASDIPKRPCREHVPRYVHRMCNTYAYVLARVNPSSTRSDPIPCHTLRYYTIRCDTIRNDTIRYALLSWSGSRRGSSEALRLPDTSRGDRHARGYRQRVNNDNSDIV